ncbi:electron transport complex subunit RsxC [Anaerolentibacter hominis]|uniref:electron transport complex subunit RsxC n=1 Tax=Anaerolentibacter hominis TaxID=3079009 RepID=UPI0031B888EF
MRLGTFIGGIHPYEGKELAMDVPTIEHLPKGDLVYPVVQHLGAPARPIVSAGDHVLMGQRIAEASAFISANICCTVSGTVKGIEKRRIVSGDMVDAIIIENDNQYTPVEGFGVHRDYKGMTKEEIRQAVKDAGIAGMGGAGFPTHVKITPKDDNAIDYILVNGAECEPYLTSDYRVMLEAPQKVVNGLKVVLALFPNAKGCIMVEDNKPKAIEILREQTKDEPNIEVKVLKTKYPQGAERMLIYAATGRTSNSSMLPSDVGCIVLNLDTTVAIYMAVCESTPLMRRIVTVSGDAIANPGNYQARIGTNYAELLEAAGGFKEKPEKVISGGTMMGMALFDLNVPVTKTSSALLALTKDEVAEHEPGPCIRCGRCVEVCPSRIVPQKMAEAAFRLNEERFVALNGMECYECGSCTYVCPAKRYLTQAFRQTRRSVLAKRKKK